MAMYYFAYGSNMNKEDLDKWCNERGYEVIKFLDVIPTMLRGYKLTFNYFSSSRNAGAANIMKSENDTVYGLLIKLDEKNKKTIREKEGCRHHCYEEIDVEVETLAGKTFQDVLTYKVVKEKEKSDFQPPTKHYLRLIIGAAEKYNFSEDYKKLLKNIKTKD